VNKRPLAVIAVFFMFGIVLARYLPGSVKFPHVFVVTLILIVISFILSISASSGEIGRTQLSSALPRTFRPRSLRSFAPRNDSVRNIFLLLSVISFAILLYANSNTYPSNHIRHILGEERLKTNIVGIIRSPALTRKPYYGKINSTYLFEVEGIKRQEASNKGQATRDKRQEWSGVTGLAQIRIQTEKDHQYGDRLLVGGAIRKPGLPNDASRLRSLRSLRSKNNNVRAKSRTFNYREYLEKQNIFALINTKESNVALLAHDYKSNPILKYTYFLREKLKTLIIDNMPLKSGAFMRAILLGDRSELPKHIQKAFKNSGTMHILAISGLHIGLIAFFILYLFRLIRINRTFAYVSAILFLIFFSILTLSRPSVVRAVVMACVFLVGTLLGRRVDMYNSLGAAALFILIKNPKDLFSVGFQLSFIAVLSILYLVPKLTRLIRKDTNFYLRKFVYAPAAVSISAWVGTFPLILYYFNIITPVSIISNLFIIPLLSLLLMGGLSFILLGWMPAIGVFLAGFNSICANMIFNAAEFFSSLKFGHFNF